MAERFQPGARVCDVAAAYGLIARHTRHGGSGAQKGTGDADRCGPDLGAAGDRAIGGRCCRVSRQVHDQGQGLWGSSACVAGLQPGPQRGLGGGAEEGAVIFPDQAVRIVIASPPHSRMQTCAAGQQVDFRKGHDGLAAMAHAELGFAPKSGMMVVFRFKRGDRNKVMFWVSHGRATGPSEHCARVRS